MSKQYECKRDLHEKLLEGINILTDNVASTLGPRGRNVILKKKDTRPIVTKDGVTVAQFVEFKDPIQDVAAQIVKQAASETNSHAGDGTTTSTVLAREMFVEAQKHIVAGASPIEIKRGMDKTVQALVKEIKNISVPIKSEEDIEHIATISANGDKSIGKLIATAVDKTGKDGAVSVEDAKSMETSLEIIEGFRFDSGYYAQAFVNSPRRSSVTYHDALIMVTDQKLSSVQELLPVLEIAAREGRPFVIVAEEIEGQALASLIMNAMRGTIKIAGVKAPRYGEERRNILKDLCLSIGATFISRESGIKVSEASLEHFGTCKKIEVLKNSTTIAGGEADWDKIEERIEFLKSEFEQTEDISECEVIQERITRLASGVAIIKVGAPTEIEMIEKKHRIEDALEAVRSAQQEGIVPGGGIALLRASQKLDDLELQSPEQGIGAKIILNSLSSPVKQMAKNAGLSEDLILQTILSQKENIGFNFARGKVVDMIEHGIVDPAKVTRISLENAASVASILITTNYCIVETD